MQRLVEDGDGSGVADPGRLTAVVGNLPALKDQPVAAAEDADLAGRCAFIGDQDALVFVVDLLLSPIAGTCFPRSRHRADR